MAQLPAEIQARVAEEDEALLEAEAQLPGGDDEIHWSDIETDSSEDDEYFPPAPATHDHEAGGSREPAEPAVTTVSESQVTQPSELTSLLQQLVSQQREDRLATEARLTAIQREAALERAASEERFVGLLDRVTQRTDAQFQQMQQGMMAMFGMITQLYSHSGLAPQKPGLQGMGAPTLTVTPAPASTAAFVFFVLFFSHVNLSCFTCLSYYLCCHQSPKRGRLKASRPSMYVSVINDNHYYD